VMRATEFGVKYRAFAVDATSENLRAMEVQRSILIAGYEDYAQDIANDPEPTVRRHENAWRSRAEWVAALTPPRLLRLATMMTILPETLELAFVYSLVGRFDNELADLRLEIDSGYVQRSEVAYWRDLLRNVLIDQSRNFPLPIGEHWTDDHPFIRKFVDQRNSKGLLLRRTFSSVIGFARSEETPVVRLADVIVTIVRRFELAREFSAVQTALSHHHLGDERLAVLAWNDKPNPRERNPYLDFPYR
jgi:hypothetical protein